jgi:aquaporin Z
MNRYAAEALGTFGVVFAGTGAIVINTITGGTVTHMGVALTFGLIVMAMIFALGDISGAHMNPAVSIALVLARRFPRRELGPYVVAQCLGAFAASLLLLALFPESPTLGATLPSGSFVQSLILEGVLTFILMLVVLSISRGPKNRGTLAAFVIGGVVALEALFAGPICGASMNPARSLAPGVVSGQWTALWIYIVGPVAGAALAVPCWALVSGKGWEMGEASHPPRVGSS